MQRLLKNIILLIVFYESTFCLGGKRSSELAQDTKNTTIVTRFACSLGLNKNIIKHTHPQTGLVTPIYQVGDNYRSLLQNGAPVNDYRLIAEEHIKEVKKRVFLIGTLGLGIFVSMRIGKQPHYKKALTTIINKPSFWGVSLPGAVFIDPEKFNPIKKYQQAQIIYNFLDSEHETTSCEDPENYIISFKKALRISETNKTLNFLSQNN